METTIRSNQTSAVRSQANRIASLWKTIEFSRFGIISMLVVVLGCVGGMAASFGAGDNIFQLAMVAFPTIISLALVLAVAPMRIIMYVSGIALIMDMIVLIF